MIQAQLVDSTHTRNSWDRDEETLNGDSLTDIAIAIHGRSNASLYCKFTVEKDAKSRMCHVFIKYRRASAVALNSVAELAFLSEMIGAIVCKGHTFNNDSKEEVSLSSTIIVYVCLRRQRTPLP